MRTGRLWVYRFLTALMPESRFYGFKVAVLRWAGIKIGSGVRIYSSTSFQGSGNIEIGDDVFIGPRCILTASAGATLHIGNNVNIGAMCYIATGTHLVDPDGDRTCGEGFGRDVIIEDGAWLTVHILVLPGVMEERMVIGKKAMVIGGGVITASVPERAVMQGVPATQIATLKFRRQRKKV